MTLMSDRKLRKQIDRLRFRLDEPEQTLEAIREGRVDAFVVENRRGHRVYTLNDLEPPYRLIVEEMREGAATLTGDSTVVYCNAQLERMFGKSRDNILGHPFRVLLELDQRSAFDKFFRDLGGGTARADLVIYGAEGEIPVQITGSSVRIDGESVYCLIVTDMREHRHREELRVAKEAAEQANRAKDEFLATVSHEVRAPITSILGWIGMMQMGMVAEENRPAALENMRQSATALSKIIDDILDISHLSSGKLSLQVTSIDNLCEIVHGVCDAVRPVAAQKKIYVEETLLPEPVPIVGDRDRLRQVFSNIVNNSLKFTPPGGRISVDCRRAGRSVMVIVRDDGDGIAADFLPHVFERFKQGQNSMTGSRGGLGLGLAIVKQLVEEHDGTVRVFSDGPGHGTTVTVELSTAS